MKVAVTASSGRLGHALLRLLPDRVGPGNVIAVARRPERIAVPGVERRAGDYQSVASMTAALRGAEEVVMISAPVVGDTDRLAMHRNVIAAARAAGVRRVLYTSVIGNGLEAGTTFEPSSRMNRQTEADLAASGLAWVVGRNGFYLELDVAHMVRWAAETGVYTNAGGDGRCSYITIDEIACAYAQMIGDPRHDGHTYNIGGEALTQAGLVAIACRVFGFRLRYEAIDDEAMIEKFRRTMPERGEAVWRMLGGAFQAMRRGALDVHSDFAAAAGRPAKPMEEMMRDVRRKREAQA